MLTLTGILHTVVFLVTCGRYYLDILKDGLWNAIGADAMRAAAVWALVVGILLILWGETLQHYQNATGKPAPTFIGWSVLVFSIIGILAMPLSGFWLFIPQAIIILAANRKKKG